MSSKATRVGHRANCESARKPLCACPCGGAEHGWQGALEIAAAPSDDGLLQRESDAEESWRTVRKEAEESAGSRRKPWQETAGGQAAALDVFVVEVIRWLRRDRKVYRATKQVGEPFRISRDKGPEGPPERSAHEEQEHFVETHVIPKLRREFGDRHIDGFQAKARAAHFWCELLAQTAHALAEFDKRYDQARQAVVTALTTAAEKRPDGWTDLLAEQVVIRRAVAMVFEYLPSVATGGVVAPNEVGPLVWPVRVLTVLMCREPRRHPAVLEYCVKPIGEHGPAEIREQAKDRLREAFPPLWTPTADGP